MPPTSARPTLVDLTVPGQKKRDDQKSLQPTDVLARIREPWLLCQKVISKVRNKVFRDTLDEMARPRGTRAM